MWCMDFKRKSAHDTRTSKMPMEDLLRRQINCPVSCQRNSYSGSGRYPSLAKRYVIILATKDTRKFRRSDPTIDPMIDPTIDPRIDPKIDPKIDPRIDPTFDPLIDQWVLQGLLRRWPWQWHLLRMPITSWCIETWQQHTTKMQIYFSLLANGWAVGTWCLPCNMPFATA